MQSRPFGRTGLTVSEIGFGCARIGGVFGGTSRSDLVRLLRDARAAGITLFDTADMYTQGESERLVGEAFRGARQNVVIASKFGYVLPAQKRLISRIKPLVRPLVARLGLRSEQLRAGLRGTVAQQDFSPAYIESAVEASLRRLGTDYIDIYQLHSPPVEVLERGEFVDTLERLRQQGKIRHWGVACERAEDVARCLAYASMGSVQVPLSALEQAALEAAIPRAAEAGLGVIARQVFASGLLTRRLDAIDVDRLDGDPAAAQRKWRQLQAYASIVGEGGLDATALALKFGLAQPGVSVVLVGMSRPDQLRATLEALQAPALSSAEAERLRCLAR